MVFIRGLKDGEVKYKDFISGLIGFVMDSLYTDINSDDLLRLWLCSYNERLFSTIASFCSLAKPFASRLISGLIGFVMDSLYIKHGIALEEFPKEYIKTIKKLFEMYDSSDFDVLFQECLYILLAPCFPFWL